MKDVFRDLLSSNDKALEKKEGDQQQTRTTVYSFGELDGDYEDSPILFKGLLSIGVDGVSNTLVISSTAALMETLTALVEELDQAAETTSSVSVLKVDPSVDLSLIQERLNKAMGISNQQRVPAEGRPPQGYNNMLPNGQPIPQE